mgnify:CR=1 FL=1
MNIKIIEYIKKNISNKQSCMIPSGYIKNGKKAIAQARLQNNAQRIKGKHNRP